MNQLGPPDSPALRVLSGRGLGERGYQPLKAGGDTKRGYGKAGKSKGRQKTTTSERSGEGYKAEDPKVLQEAPPPRGQAKQKNQRLRSEGGRSWKKERRSWTEGEVDAESRADSMQKPGI